MEIFSWQQCTQKQLFRFPNVTRRDASKNTRNRVLKAQNKQKLQFQTVFLVVAPTS